MSGSERTSRSRTSGLRRRPRGSSFGPSEPRRRDASAGEIPVGGEGGNTSRGGGGSSARRASGSIAVSRPRPSLGTRGLRVFVGRNRSGPLDSPTHGPGRKLSIARPTPPGSSAPGARTRSSASGALRMRGSSRRGTPTGRKRGPDGEWLPRHRPSEDAPRTDPLHRRGSRARARRSPGRRCGPPSGHRAATEDRRERESRLAPCEGPAAGSVRNPRPGAHDRPDLARRERRGQREGARMADLDGVGHRLPARPNGGLGRDLSRTPWSARVRDSGRPRGPVRATRPR